jgi:hypothetical protein
MIMSNTYLYAKIPDPNGELRQIAEVIAGVNGIPVGQAIGLALRNAHQVFSAVHKLPALRATTTQESPQEPLWEASETQLQAVGTDIREIYEKSLDRTKRPYIQKGRTAQIGRGIGRTVTLKGIHRFPVTVPYRHIIKGMVALACGAYPTVEDAKRYHDKVARVLQGPYAWLYYPGHGELDINGKEFV